MNKKGRVSFWDIIAWLVLAGIVIWVILKITGVIQTPLWFEYAPIYGAVYLAGWAMHKLERATEDIRSVKRSIKYIGEDLNKVRTNCPIFENK